MRSQLTRVDCHVFPYDPPGETVIWTVTHRQKADSASAIVAFRLEEMAESSAFRFPQNRGAGSGDDRARTRKASFHPFLLGVKWLILSASRARLVTLI